MRAQTVGFRNHMALELQTREVQIFELQRLLAEQRETIEAHTCACVCSVCVRVSV